ncbi:hypothetical protein B0H17DRAFT_1144357 [Mycena rosella]|uniref:Uncharacterized protein n=1 Tax=Mycena rosella TaxID=1033263 RepID=A0AAD7G771_MYCRO|nr:hypothetical protein B0H17DRAFT_1144357 [Mycena rosella]
MMSPSARRVNQIRTALRTKLGLFLRLSLDFGRINDIESPSTSIQERGGVFQLSWSRLTIAVKYTVTDVYSIRQDGQRVMEVHRVPLPNPIVLILEGVVLPLNPYL